MSGPRTIHPNAITKGDNAPRAACAGQWDLFDSTLVTDHWQAREICADCPILLQCRESAAVQEQRLRSRGDKAGGIEGTWAGMLFGKARYPERDKLPDSTLDDRMFEVDYGIPIEDVRAAHARYVKDRARDELTVEYERIYQRESHLRRRRAKRAEKAA